MVRLLKIGVVILTLVVGSGTTATPGASQSLPTADGLRDQLARELPALWRLESFTLAPPTTDGKEGAAKETGDKTIVQPFTAVVGLAAATYAVDSQRGPFTLLRPVAEQGTRKTLSGLVKSTPRDGAWTSRFGIRNGFVIDNIGLPIDRFPGRTAVLGTTATTELLNDLEQGAKRKAEAEAENIRQQREALDLQLAAVKADAQRIAADRALIDQRAAALADLKRQLLDGERPARIAALEAALNGKDPSLRAMAFATAFSGRDALVANLALRALLTQKKALPIQLFATRENKDSETVLNNLGPLGLTIERFDPLTGVLEGKMGAPGYSITLPGGAVGTLTQTELTINTYGCTLQLRLSDMATLDGIYRCQTLPTLIARITLD